MNCKRCGWDFPLSAGQYAPLWDGHLFRRYPWLYDMPWGPYCSTCIGIVLDDVNSRAEKYRRRLAQVLDWADVANMHN